MSDSQKSMHSDLKKKIILFDGVCNLCNSAVTFIIKRDSNDSFRFASLQSDTGRTLLKKHAIDPILTDSIILIDNEKVSDKSSAALRIARELKGTIRVLYLFIILPKFIRDRIYDFIARNRYRWFGKKSSCMIPTTNLKNKFLS